MTDASTGREERRARRALSQCRRVVVKIGSRALALADLEANQPTMFARLAADVAAILAGAIAGTRERRKRKAGRSVVIVSSGAIALGIDRLGMGRRPTAMPALQAAAAAGQSRLMQRYGDAFAAHGLAVAQVLLTHADLANRQRANNARAALTKLLDLGAVPIINENDAVAVDEIRFGDNDELAAMVTPLCDGDLLVLLSDVEGLMDRKGARVRFANQVDDQLLALVTDQRSSVGRGGMTSKLQAAKTATLGGAHVVIASAAVPQVVQRIVTGEDIGTLVSAVARRLAPRKHWIAYTLRPRGVAIVDEGAADAIQHRGRSILCVGVLGVRGAFVSGDSIAITTADGREIARGLVRLSAPEAARLAQDRAGPSAVLVHRDDLVVSQPLAPQAAAAGTDP